MVGELTVQCLDGCVEFSIGSTHDVMRPGDLKCLAGGIPHSLRAIDDSSVLVRLLLQGALNAARGAGGFCRLHNAHKSLQTERAQRTTPAADCGNAAVQQRQPACCLLDIYCSVTPRRKM